MHVSKAVFLNQSAVTQAPWGAVWVSLGAVSLGRSLPWIIVIGLHDEGRTSSSTIITNGNDGPLSHTMAIQDFHPGQASCRAGLSIQEKMEVCHLSQMVGIWCEEGTV